MKNADLNKIEKQVNKIDFDQDPINNLIGQIDDLYIILDENNHINTFNEKLSSIKSDIARLNASDADFVERQGAFNNAKKEILDILGEIKTHA